MDERSIRVGAFALHSVFVSLEIIGILWYPTQFPGITNTILIDDSLGSKIYSRKFAAGTWNLQNFITRPRCIMDPTLRVCKRCRVSWDQRIISCLDTTAESFPCSI